MFANNPTHLAVAKVPNSQTFFGGFSPVAQRVILSFPNPGDRMQSVPRDDGRALDFDVSKAAPCPPPAWAGCGLGNGAMGSSSCVGTEEVPPTQLFFLSPGTRFSIRDTANVSLQHITAGSAATVDFACRTLLQDRYFRCETSFVHNDSGGKE